MNKKEVEKLLLMEGVTDNTHPLEKKKIQQSDENFWNEGDHEAKRVNDANRMMNRHVLSKIRRQDVSLRPCNQKAILHGYSAKTDHLFQNDSGEITFGGVEVKNRDKIVCNAGQAKSQLLAYGARSIIPFFLVYTDLEAIAAIFYFNSDYRSIENRVFYSMPDFWSFMVVLVSSLPSVESLLAPGCEVPNRFSAAGLVFDRYELSM
eukprot:CAMPEP_0172180168 /NCGR_PEP_ID=MMETSP1050-20130122/17055_1 /TAXON_ID=233186 /ORGANISM="Cryptomonas curvata, Strain CCAP979/52" /LENGTH=205 /DNA_ID=CAMNT_0012853195 /DNA_START=513 /DNA_END=1130 /DNA_ORIENTATION=+